MQQLSKQQREQESRYEYPYHYIASCDGNNFSQTQTLVWGYEYLSYLFFVLNKAMEIGFESLLDVGCGDGRFLIELRRQAPGKRLVGVDYSQRAIDYAKIMGPEIQWVNEDIRDQSMLGEEFSLITLIETLEHIPPEGIYDFLRGIHHVSKERGSLIITVCATGKIGNRINRHHG